MNKIIALSSALALVGLSASAFAGDNTLRGGFVRVEAGRSDVNASADGVGSESDHDNAFSVRGGYWFNGNFAIEGFYTTAFDKSFTDGVDTVKLKASTIGLGVVGKKNFTEVPNEGAFIMGRAGIARGKIDASVTGLGSGSDTSTKPYFGVGIGYDFTPNFGLSLNYDYLKGSGEGFDITAKPLMLGAEFRF